MIIQDSLRAGRCSLRLKYHYPLQTHSMFQPQASSSNAEAATCSSGDGTLPLGLAKIDAMLHLQHFVQADGWGAGLGSSTSLDQDQQSGAPEGSGLRTLWSRSKRR